MRPTQLTYEPTGSAGEESHRAFAAWSRRRVARAAGYVFMAALLAFVCSGTAGPALLGYHSTVVYGGSMGSSLPSGSVAVTETIGANNVRAGDVVAFSRNDTHSTVMHRVVAIEERDGQRTATLQGDRNASADPQPLVLTGRGDRLVYYVPLLGYVLHYSRTPRVLVPVLVGLVALLAGGRLRGRRPAGARAKASR